MVTEGFCCCLVGTFPLTRSRSQSMSNRKRAVKSCRSSLQAKVPQAGDLEPLSASFQRAVIAGGPELAQPLRMWEQRVSWTVQP